MKLFKSHRPKDGAPTRQTAAAQPAPKDAKPGDVRPKELGGPEGPEPTRYGDWERKGVCYDF